MLAALITHRQNQILVFDNEETNLYVCLMSEAHRRKKNPERVRVQLLESAVELALERGLSNVGVAAVAKAAGVTRGGFFHHFPSKQDLVDAVFDMMLEKHGDEILTSMAADEVSHGRFTRAYLASSFHAWTDNAGSAAMWASTIADARLREKWKSWYQNFVSLHASDEKAAKFEAVRRAADGVWIGVLVNIVPDDTAALHETLLSVLTVELTTVSHDLLTEHG